MTDDDDDDDDDDTDDDDDDVNTNTDTNDTNDADDNVPDFLSKRRTPIRKFFSKQKNSFTRSGSSKPTSFVKKFENGHV